MAATRSLDTLVKAARLYYEDGLSQGEVARVLGLSGATVSRVLAAARDQGIVEVRIHDPRSPVRRVAELEQRLVDEFGLTEARVGAPNASADALQSVGRLAADLFGERLGQMRRVGLSWGSTLEAFVAEVPERVVPLLKVLPLAGGNPGLDMAAAGGTLVQALARRCGVQPSRFLAPAVVESPHTKQAFVAESSIRTALERAAEVDHAFVGVGTLGVRSSVTIVEDMKLSEAELATFLAQKPAGDISGRFFDDTGAEVGPPTSDRVIGLSLDDLRRVPCVIGLAAGQEKARGFRAALRTGVLDIAVLDVALAQAVLQRN
ncbi:sugar-binding transcriptional regulator [Micropruina sonneratiae]|uniref:sugar-binding transcriptional regulator n=1 Tax=Micropruina sonneratiae TaxID=2986940 RepID=UPI002226535D|nr:sugar-binding domain-containing protein [Micropruina sp. KQZ13P-5]MCW3158945.1 MarR family transcriptional regulator [Micropruina sp. KQZ13P-5]